MIKRAAVAIASCVLFLSVGVCALAQKPKAPKFRKASIQTVFGSVAVVPPSGKKVGSIGNIEVKKLLHQTDTSVLGLSGRTKRDGYAHEERSLLEFVAVVRGMDSVLTGWVEGWNMNDAAKQEWDIVGSSQNGCIITTQLYAGMDDSYGEPLPNYENTNAYLIVQGGTAMPIEDDGYNMYHRLDANCITPKPTNDNYHTRVMRGAPYYSCSQHTPDMDYGTNVLVALGTGKVLELDNTYTKITIDDCNIIGVISYMFGDTNREQPIYYEYEEGDYVREYHLINPDNGTSKKIR